ncbi:MAG: hypothetical protein MMC23_009366 [Stictis urceolatum]|nr:hypothetical protein [Stictis urceolata]
MSSSLSKPTDRKDMMVRLRACVERGEAIIGAGAVGLTAKFIEKGGADLIIIYNSGRFRMAGRGSLAGLMPYGNANEVVLEMNFPTVGLIDGAFRQNLEETGMGFDK